MFLVSRVNVGWRRRGGRFGRKVVGKSQTVGDSNVYFNVKKRLFFKW